MIWFYDPTDNIVSLVDHQLWFLVTREDLWGIHNRGLVFFLAKSVHGESYSPTDNVGSHANITSTIAQLVSDNCLVFMTISYQWHQSSHISQKRINQQRKLAHTQSWGFLVKSFVCFVSFLLASSSSRRHFLIMEFWIDGMAEQWSRVIAKGEGCFFFPTHARKSPLIPSPQFALTLQLSVSVVPM